MSTTEITTAISWIDTNIEAAPMLLKASLMNIKTQIEKAPATFALNAPLCQSSCRLDRI